MEERTPGKRQEWVKRKCNTSLWLRALAGFRKEVWNRRATGPKSAAA